MKRGRRSLREQAKSQIIEVLSNTQTPLTTSSVRRLVAGKYSKKLSWNTVQKYLDELMKENQISGVSLPHSKIKNKTGLTVYILKK